jgi:hypothetical protein
VQDKEVEPVEEAESPRTSTDSSTDRFEPVRTGTQHKNELDRTETIARSSSDLEQPPLLRRKTTVATIEDADRRELQQIFSALSQRRTSIAEMDDPRVDPLHEAFDLPKFLKMFRHQLENEGIHMRKIGMVYKNLNIFGSGAALQLQQTVADFVLAPLRIGEWFSGGKKAHKQILRNFDGVIRSGEMLIVLGRPGSGCSTLLKTMCGELHGLDMDKNSAVHYNGIPQEQMKKEFKGEAIYNQEARTPIHAYCDPYSDN